MKKIIFLITIIFLLGGCYDNIELNDLSIISAMGIDYINNNFYVTYEIYNDNKSENTQELLSYTISGMGNSISSAITDANYKTGKKAYFAHLKIIILSSSIIEKHFNDITDFLFRSTDIRDEFQLVVSDNYSPKEILERNSERHPVVGDLINTLLNLEKYNNGIATNETFKSIMSKLIGAKQDIILNSITVNDDRLSLGKYYIFNKYKWVNNISKTKTSIYNMLSQNISNTLLSKKYKGKNFAIGTKSVNFKLDIDKDKIIIKGSLEGIIKENNPGLDLNKIKTYKKINKDFSKLIEDEIIALIKHLQNSHSDILGFEDIYYKKYNQDNYNLWITNEVEVNVDLRINKQGYIFEVNNE